MTRPKTRNKNRGAANKRESYIPPSRPTKRVSWATANDEPWEAQDHRTPAAAQDAGNKPKSRRGGRRRNRNRNKRGKRGPKAEIERNSKAAPVVSKPKRPITPSTDDSPPPKDVKALTGKFRISEKDTAWSPPTHSPRMTPAKPRRGGKSRKNANRSGFKLNPNVAEFVPHASLQQQADLVAELTRLPPQQVAPRYFAPAGIDPFAPVDPAVPSFFAPSPGGTQPQLYSEGDNTQDTYDQEHQQLDISPPRLSAWRNAGIGDQPGGGSWILYWNPPTSLKHNNSGAEYLHGTKALVTFEGINDFWGKLDGQRKPSQMGRNTGAHNLMIFRSGLVPAWETFPFGGCWILTFPRDTTKPQFIDSAWESLMFMMVSEGFGTQQVVGASLHIRGRNYRITVWNRDNRNDNPVRFEIADQLRIKLNLGNRAQLSYKSFKQAVEDGSTTRRGTSYEFIKVRY